jgi:hypothetical protein
MAAMIFKLPPQFGQCSMSMLKTRLSSRAVRVDTQLWGERPGRARQALQPQQ